MDTYYVLTTLFMYFSLKNFTSTLELIKDMFVHDKFLLYFSVESCPHYHGETLLCLKGPLTVSTGDGSDQTVHPFFLNVWVTPTHPIEPPKCRYSPTVDQIQVKATKLTIKYICRSN